MTTAKFNNENLKEKYTELVEERLSLLQKQGLISQALFYTYL